jgi:adenylate cyclase
LCRDRILVRELDKIRVKGKTSAVSIYELIGDHRQHLDDSTKKFLDLYHLGRTAYTGRSFQKAIAYFDDAYSLRPTDQAVTVHLERCKNYLRQPPSDAWDGVHTMTSK